MPDASPDKADSSKPDPSEYGASADRLDTLVARLCRAHRSRMAERLRAHGLHCGPDRLLLTLHGTGGLRQNELAERLAVEPPTVSRLVQRLERDGLVRRTDDPEDARAVQVELTDAGHAKRKQVAACWAEHEDDLAAALDADEADTLRHLLQKVLARLE
jgi:DNA-binding MarR family transcriptional regulator